MDEYEEAVLFTLASLESRLDRIEYVLSGGKKLAEEKPKTFPERVQRIEKSLQELTGKTALLHDVQQLSTSLRSEVCHIC
jgi:predicted O-linked N-acetylglucosamine transferase (SPINDLY family)